MNPVSNNSFGHDFNQFVLQNTQNAIPKPFDVEKLTKPQKDIKKTDKTKKDMKRQKDEKEDGTN